MDQRHELYLLADALTELKESEREGLLARYAGAGDLLGAVGRDPLLAAYTRGQLERRLKEAVSAAERHGVRVLIREDPAFPRGLFRLRRPPMTLYALGDCGLLQTPCLSVVGMRDCSAEAYERVRGLACTAAKAGYTVVSGMALGCDAAAHRGALDATGRTVAVLAGSVRSIYPRENAALYREICERGLVLSERAEGTRIYAASFLQRNRIVAALSQAVLVTYARARSGTWSTARHAVNCGAKLLMLKGGAEALPEFAESGRRVVSDGADLLAALGEETGVQLSFGDPSADEPARDAGADWVARCLSAGERSFSKLSQATGLAAKELAGRLFELELEGRVQRLPGNRYRLRTEP